MFLCLVKEQTIYVPISVECDHCFTHSQFHTVLGLANCAYFRNTNPKLVRGIAKDKVVVSTL